MHLSKPRIFVGAMIWLVVVGVVGFRYAPGWLSSDAEAAKSLAAYTTGRRTTMSLKFEKPAIVRIADPIFFMNDEGELVQVGSIRQVESPESKNYKEAECDWASATFFSTAPDISTGDYVTYHQTPNSMDWVARFLFPKQRREEIGAMVAEVYATHSSEVLAELMPILQEAWLETRVIVRDELLASLARHKSDFESIGERYRSEIVEGELLPLVNEEIWPIVRKQAEPLLEEVGQQIWTKASVWRFGWRAIYDASPLPGRNLTQAEFARFTEEQAVPVLTENLPKFLEAQQVILEQIVQNPQVQQVIRDSLIKIGNDSELHGVLLEVLRESIFENPRLREALEATWNRPDLQKVFKLTDERLAPTIEEIGGSIFGSPYDGVTPEFARILRNKILLKDMRWFILHHAENEKNAGDEIHDNEDSDTLTVIRGKSNLENPFYYPARER